MGSFTYQATIIEVHDGDTITVDLDMGRHVWWRGAKHRIQNINARELAMPGGPEARDNLRTLLPVGSIFTLQSLKPYKYGDEYMCEVLIPQGPLSEYLIATYWAARWNGAGDRSQFLPPWPRPETPPVVT